MLASERSSTSSNRSVCYDSRFVTILSATAWGEALIAYRAPRSFYLVTLLFAERIWLAPRQSFLSLSPSRSRLSCFSPFLGNRAVDIAAAIQFVALRRTPGRRSRLIGHGHLNPFVRSFISSDARSRWSSRDKRAASAPISLIRPSVCLPACLPASQCCARDSAGFRTRAIIESKRSRAPASADSVR